jgi:ABC-type lipoprotein export system ATPase subunit
MTAPVLNAPIVLRGVGVDVPGRPGLLSNIELAIEPGERVAVMGPSGSGKSTLLAVLGGLLTPTRGEIQRSASQSIGWIFQQTFILGYRTTLDNVALAGLAAGLSWHDSMRRAAVAVSSVGLDAQSQSLAGQVSGGERQRIGVARALLGGHSLILADEPTASLDAQLVSTVTRLLLDETDPGSIVVLATHDTRVAEQCPTVLRLDGGQLVRID